jgi:hypothetical protein
MRARFFVLLVACGFLTNALHAQGCVKGCVVGGAGGAGHNPFLHQGDWQVSFGYSGYVSDLHYQGRNPFPELDPFGPDNTQHLLSLGFQRGFTDRLSLGVTVPLHFNDFVLTRVPPGSTTGQLVRDGTSSRGLGDVSVRGRYWVLDTFENGGRNFSVGLAVKLPTGKSSVSDSIFGRQIPVDWSVQLGDGGWGFAPSLDGFYALNRLTFHGSALYLFNPKNTTDTPAFFPMLSNRPDAPLNTVADQFNGHAGVSLSLGPRLPTPTISYRVAAVPVTDVIGKSEGFRRPATLGFVEPGFEYSFGPHRLSFSVAFLQYVNVKDAPLTPRREDATVPNHVFSVGYTTRF